MFYLFHQNNAYGKFTLPAREVFIEADDVVQALTIAESVPGMYFKGSPDLDCPCCGPRWNRHPLEYTMEEFEDYKVSHRDYMAWLSPKVPYMFIRYADGKEETLLNDGKSEETPIPDMSVCEATECPTPIEDEVKNDSIVSDDA